MKLRNKRGQGTLEYVILVTAVIVVVIYFLMGTGQGSFQNTMNGALNEATEGMATMSGRFDAAFAPPAP
ncbi:class III signal peptide-containing protein [Candidatus Nomurabacteria bacterium]|nr:class III signal peptide-containing protein [Candidatus Nomurabacteria bacterium]